MTATQRLRAAALARGFDAVGFARAEDLRGTVDGRRFLAWLAEGAHGDMAYLERGPQRRLDPAAVLPGARTVMVVALTYRRQDDEPVLRAGSGRIARYARRRDYHKIFAARLKVLQSDLSAVLPGASARAYVDTGPVLEKLWAERAGLGWRGKHTNLVSRLHGSWLLLGVLLIDRDLEPDTPERDHCGTCTRCLDACPTAAFPAPYRLDARRCISYLTIEHRGAIPMELRPLLGDRVFGCDDCLDVCPWNRFARAGREADFRPRPETLGPLLADLVTMDEPEFLRRFAGTPVTRAKRAGLARNACVALGNVGEPRDLPALDAALLDPSPLVQEHAAWAIERIRERQEANAP